MLVGAARGVEHDKFALVERLEATPRFRCAGAPGLPGSDCVMYLGPGLRGPYTPLSSHEAWQGQAGQTRNKIRHCQADVAPDRGSPHLDAGGEA